MEKQYLHSGRLGLLLGVLGLYVGMIVASQSRVAYSETPDINQDQDCCSLNELISDKEERLRALEIYVKTLCKTAGRQSRDASFTPAKRKVVSKASLLKKKSRSKQKLRKIRSRVLKRKILRAADRIFTWPLHTRNFRLSSRFGMRMLRGKKSFHKGIDLAANKGTPVYAAREGTVIEARFLPGYGNSVLIAHSSRFKTRYAHLQAILVQEGQKVFPEESIGTVGTTGHVLRTRFGSSGSHLHFEVYSNGKAVNPLDFLV